MYIADSEAHYIEEDRKNAERYHTLQRDRLFASRFGQQRLEPQDNIENWFLNRCAELAKQDMRQFFRAGFQQAIELREISECCHMFALPYIFQKTMISHAEALSKQIKDKSVEPQKPLGANYDLLQLMKNQCGERSRLLGLLTPEYFAAHRRKVEDSCSQVRARGHGCSDC